MTYWFTILNRRWNVEQSITDTMLRRYVKAGYITAEEYEQITGNPY